MTLLLTQGNALRIPLADESVHCVVTSPPYWGLRKYQGNMAQVWGGDPYCAHKWNKTERVLQKGTVSEKQSTHRGNDGHGFLTQDSTCLHCGALRIDNQLGLEPTPEQYVENMVAVFREVKRVLRADGQLWLNLGDSYNGSGGAGGDYNEGGWKEGQPRYPGRKVINLKPKDLCGIPWRVAFALQADGWWLRQQYPWVKVNPMLESADDRPNSAVEFMFLLTKSPRYYFDMDGAKECLAIKRNWRNGDGMLLLDCPTFAYSSSVETSHLAPVPAHEVDGGMIHTILPDCPDHGDQFVPLAKEFYDGREADYWKRIERICSRLAQVPFGDCAPTDQQRALGYSEQSSGYYPRAYSPTAIDHNNETHRMALALDSTPPYIPFFETAPRIDDKQVLLSSFVQHLCIYGNSILKDGCDAHLLECIPHRIVDKSSLFLALTCTCNYYRYYTTKSDHFATYPPALVEPCIKAGTSERGVCPECGAPWERVVSDRKSPYEDTRGVDGEFTEHHVPTSETKLSGPKMQAWLDANPKTTLGWQPTCVHTDEWFDALAKHSGKPRKSSEPVPATVFDPFVGSGTTLQVARALGRSGVGLDLSAEYLQLARQRLSLDALDAWAEGAKKDGKAVTDLPMFEEMK